MNGQKPQRKIPSKTEHRLIQPGDEHDCPGLNDVPTSCPICDGGLGVCAVCGMAEAQLDDSPVCPGGPSVRPTSPEDAQVRIEDLAALAELRGQQAVLAICVGTDGVLRAVTYGSTPRGSLAMSQWGPGLLTQESVTKVPFQTVFGVGNGGTPLPLTAAERVEAFKMGVPSELM